MLRELVMNKLKFIRFDNQLRKAEKKTKTLRKGYSCKAEVCYYIMDDIIYSTAMLFMLITTHLFSIWSQHFISSNLIYRIQQQTNCISNVSAKKRKRLEYE